MSKLKNVKVLTAAGMLLAIAVILSFFKIPITDVFEIRFANIPVAVAGMLFGPGVGGVIGALSDLLGYVVRPTGPYFPGFTISSALSGIIFGLILGRGKTTLTRIIVACALYTVVVAVFLNTLWLSLLYGTPFWGLLVVRLPKELVMLAVHVLLLSLLAKPITLFMQPRKGESA